MNNKHCTYVLSLVRTFWPIVIVIAGIILIAGAYASQVRHNGVLIAEVDTRVDQNSLAIAIIVTKLDAMNTRLATMNTRQEAMHKEILGKLPGGQ